MGSLMFNPASAQCPDCSVEFVKKCPTHVYCQSCSSARDLERKKLWARNNPPGPEQVARNCARLNSRCVSNGLARNAETARGLMWIHDELPAMVWSSRFCIPFSYAMSKNHIYTTTRFGHAALRAESRATRDEIEILARSVSTRFKVVQAKVYLDILVQKPDHRGDAVNVIDLVCDGIKRGLGVDDRWFCIRRLDWQIVKTEPQLLIGIGQAETEHHQVCSHCGLILALDQFNKKRSVKLGVDRACRECRRVKPDDGEPRAEVTVCEPDQEDNVDG